MYAIFHSRLASNPALSGPIFSHPFLASTEKEVFFLAHNGSVEPEPPAGALLVDSEWALAQIVKAGAIDLALPALKERTAKGGALNLLVLSLPRAPEHPAALHALNFFKTEDPSRIDYYKMWTANVQDGKVVFSSTFKTLLPGLTEVQSAPHGDVMTFFRGPGEGQPECQDGGFAIAATDYDNFQRQHGDRP